MSVLVRILLAIAPCLALIGCRGPGPADHDGRAQAEAFLASIRSGQLEPAWQSTSDEFKSIMGLDSLRELVAHNPALLSEPTYDSTLTRQHDGLTLAECVFHATPPTSGKVAPPTPTTITILLSAPTGAWKVDHMALE
jgi:hypothetical protein